MSCYNQSASHNLYGVSALGAWQLTGVHFGANLATTSLHLASCVHERPKCMLSWYQVLYSLTTD